MSVFFLIGDIRRRNHLPKVWADLFCNLPQRAELPISTSEKDPDVTRLKPNQQRRVSCAFGGGD